MSKDLQFSASSVRLRLAADGPTLGWTVESKNGSRVCSRVFATPDDSESDPAAGLLVTYLDTDSSRKFAVAIRSNHPDDTQRRAPFFTIDVEIPPQDFGSSSFLQMEVFTLHVIAEQGKVFLPPDLQSLQAIVAKGFDYESKRSELADRLQENQTLLHDPMPESHSFESRSNRSLDEALVTLRLPPKSAEDFKFIATTCRYPGFAFESKRVDTASFDIIADKHSHASGMLMLGDQIYADATASLFDKLTSIEKFQERYHAMFRSPGFAKAVRAIPSYMTGDDHEFNDSWSVPDNVLRKELYRAAQQSYGIYQLSHSPFAGALNAPPFDYSFTCGPVAVYVMDTLSNRNTKVPGQEVIVSAQQLTDFKQWLTGVKLDYVILATGGVVAPGFQVALNAKGETDVSRAQGWENWQAFNAQRIKLLDILAASAKKILLVSGDYHCAAKASIKTRGGEKLIATAVVVPPAYAPMRYVNAKVGALAPLEKTGTYEIKLNETEEGSGFAIIKIENGEWAVTFETQPVADV